MRIWQPRVGGLAEICWISRREVPSFICWSTSPVAGDPEGCCASLSARCSAPGPGAFCMGDPGCRYRREMPRRQLLACVVLNRECGPPPGTAGAMGVPAAPGGLSSVGHPLGCIGGENQSGFKPSPCSAGAKSPSGALAGKGASWYPQCFGGRQGEPATSCVTRSEHQREMPERSNNPR